MRLVIWTTMPTHHQSAFFAALRDTGMDLRVCYLSQVSEARRALGWEVPERLPEGEQYVSSPLASLVLVDRWADHVHVVGSAIGAILPALALRLSWRRVPWVHWSEPGVPRPWWHPKRALLRAYAALVNNRALGAFAIGDAAREDFERWGIDPTRIRFLPYGIAPLVPPVGPCEPGSGPRFVQVGRLSAAKGVDVLLEAFAGIAGRYPRARLDLVGSGPQETQFRALAQRLDVGAAVTFVGSVAVREVARHVSRADVLVLASRGDGWGVVLNEGASLGKALVATDATGAARHLIRDGENGFRIPAGDATALRNVLQLYCEEPGLAAAQGRVSARIFEDHTPAANARRLRDGLASLLPAR